MPEDQPIQVSTARKTTRVKSKPSPPPPPPAEPEPEKPKDLVLASDVWAAYGQLRSVSATAKSLKISEDKVRATLEADRPRLQKLISTLHESRAAAWEARERRVGFMLDSVLDTYDGLLLEIKSAMEDGRITRIRDQNGHELPVLDAIQMVVMGRIAEQTTKIAQVARTLAASKDDIVTAIEMEDPELQDPNFMADEAIAELVNEAGLDLPPMLAAKIKRITNTATSPDKKDNASSGDKA